MRPSNNLENKTPSDTYWRLQLVCKKVQARRSLEPPLEYHQDQISSGSGVAYGSLAVSKTLWQQLTSLPELHFRLKRFILLVQMKKRISMNYGSSTSSWKPWWWMRLNLILVMQDIYINSNLNALRKFTSSNRSTKFKDILAWNISQMIMKTFSISQRIVISYAMKWYIPL